MKDTIKAELKAHVQLIREESDENTSIDDIYNAAFNQDAYIIYYYKCEEWLKEHDLSAWEAIREVMEWHEEMGITLDIEKINSESIVSLLAYIYGEELKREELEAEEAKELER